MDEIFSFKGSPIEDCSDRQFFFSPDINAISNESQLERGLTADSVNHLDMVRCTLPFSSTDMQRDEMLLDLPPENLAGVTNLSLQNDLTIGNWTVRSTDGFQEEMMQDGLESSEAMDPNLFVPKAPDEMTPSSIMVSPETAEDFVLVYVLISLSNETINGNSAWKRLLTSVVVTQSVQEQELSLPISRDSFMCFQHSTDNPVDAENQTREIAARISFNNYVLSPQTMFLFQLFLSVTEDDGKEVDLDFDWGDMDVISLIQVPKTGQILRPIDRKISRPETFSASNEGVFLGSFTFMNNEVCHYSPSEATLRERAAKSFDASTIDSVDLEREEVVIVERKNIISEANGARAGRPSHRETGQLLMTKEQVEKIIEIRERWKGLSARQRRDNVTHSDFYAFLTLNRDETAELLGVCATWLKDAIRAQGVNVWPGRPLRRTGAMLQTLKENIESAKAALRFSDPAIGETGQYEEDLRRYENEKVGLLQTRLEIVEKNVTKAYYQRFLTENGQEYLNPNWNALPPNSLPRTPKI